MAFPPRTRSSLRRACASTTQTRARRDGRTLILVHGFAASVHAWRPWVERLSNDYRLIAIDLPGHGLTETPDGYRASLEGNAELVDKLATHLGVDHFVLAGNSMGGAVSIAYAMKHAQRLDGLVLIDAAGWPGERSGRPAAACLRAAQQLALRAR